MVDGGNIQRGNSGENTQIRENFQQPKKVANREQGKQGAGGRGSEERPIQEWRSEVM